MKSIVTTILWTIFCTIAIPTVSQAETTGESAAANELIEILNQTTSLQGQFQQNQYDSQNMLLAESSGHFRMLRPGYFSWQIESPDSQQIIATPEYLWHYDMDLETVTRRPVTGSGAMSPLQILGGREELLRSQFSVSKSASGIFTLVPHDSEPGFVSLSLTLENNTISAMEIIDALNQRVVISFQAIDSNSELVIDDFAFTPPDGVDLFYYDE